MLSLVQNAARVSVLTSLESIVGLAHPGVARLAAASALELGPALWHYRDIGNGDVLALLHALAWSGLGVLLASAVVARQRTVLH